MSAFPSCTTHDVEQRSPEWYSLRSGVLTASEAGAWVAERPKVRLTIAEMKTILDDHSVEYPKSAKHGDLLDILPGPDQYMSITDVATKARDKMIARKLAEIAGCEGPPDFDVDPNGPPPRNPALWAIWNGLVLESEAREAFEKLEECKIEDIGFCLHESGRFGCSPDGKIQERNEGLEIKCPLPTTHIAYLLNGGLPDDYKAQVHTSLAVTGADAWHFFSHCPGLPPLKLRVERDQFTDDMLSGLNEFATEMDNQQERVMKMWDAAYGKGSAT